MRILWLKTELLHPIDKGARIRTYHMLRALVRHHHITYLTLDDGNAAPDAVERASEYATEVVRVPFDPAARRSPRFFAELAWTLGSPLPYALWKYRTQPFRRALQNQVDSGAFDVVVCDFLSPAVNIAGRLPVPMVLFQHNVEAEIWRRHAETARRPWTRGYFGLQWRRMERFEKAACRRFDLVVAVSEVDANLMRSSYGVERLVTVPTGVDADYYRPSGQEAVDPHHIVFVGSMDWMPNEDGVLFFTREVWPGLKRALPQATLTVVGRKPPSRVRALAEEFPGVIVTGSVPDVRPYLERAGLVVVPLRVGSGTRLKIYEALAMERPVVSTRIGAEGLPLVDGEHIALADSAAELTRRCLALLEDRAAARRLGRNGAAFVRSRFGWDQVAVQFAAHCAAVANARAEGAREENPSRPTGDEPVAAC